MNATTKKILLRALDKVDAWLDGKVTISDSLHKTAVTYLGKLEQRIAPDAEKKP